MLSILIFPGACFVFVFSEDILRIYLGNAYMGAAHLLQWLFVAVIFRTLTRPIDSLLRAKGEVYKGSWIKGIYLALMVVGVMFCARYSVEAVAISIAVTTGIHYLMMISFAQKIASVSVKDQLSALVPGSRIGAMTLLAAYLSKYMAERSHIDGVWMLLFAMICVFVGGCLLVYIRPQWLGERHVNPLFIVPERFRKFPFLNRIYKAFDEE